MKHAEWKLLAQSVAGAVAWAVFRWLEQRKRGK